jgi:hypothetical protein
MNVTNFTRSGSPIAVSQDIYYGGIDFGSGTSKCSIVKKSPDGKLTVVTNASEKMLFTEALTEEQFQQASKIVSKFKDLLRQHGCYQTGNKIGATATQVFRDAGTKGEEFLQKLGEQLETSIDILEPSEEGRLGFESVRTFSNDPTITDNDIVFECGSQSFQISFIYNRELKTFSYPVGTKMMEPVFQEICEKKDIFDPQKQTIKKSTPVITEEKLAEARNSFPDRIAGLKILDLKIRDQTKKVDEAATDAFHKARKDFEATLTKKLEESPGRVISIGFGIDLTKGLEAVARKELDQSIGEAVGNLIAPHISFTHLTQDLINRFALRMLKEINQGQELKKQTPIIDALNGVIWNDNPTIFNGPTLMAAIMQKFHFSQIEPLKEFPMAAGTLQAIIEEQS